LNLKKINLIRTTKENESISHLGRNPTPIPSLTSFSRIPSKEVYKNNKIKIWVNSRKSRRFIKLLQNQKKNPKLIPNS
jgi:hypothetical protein